MATGKREIKQKMKEKHLDNFVKGLKNGIPIALGYFAVAFTLGIQAKNAGNQICPYIYIGRRHR